MRIFAILLATLHSAMAVTKYATALIRNSDGVTQGIEGVIKFEQIGDGTSDVTVEWNVQGLTAGEHGFHIHQYGDITSNSPSTTGYHFVPDQICQPCENVNGSDVPGSQCTSNLDLCLSDSFQGFPPSMYRHPGDMGNITADVNGASTGTRVLGQGKMSLEDSLRSIVGRSVSIHQNPDNGTSPWGFAGPQVAWGVVGIANPDDFGSSQSTNPAVPADNVHVSHLVCHFRGTLDGVSTQNVKGTILIHKDQIGSTEVKLYGKLSGLSKGTHSFHFHEWGSLSSVGNIYEPNGEVLLVESSTLEVPADNAEFKFTSTFSADTLALHVGRSLTIHDGPTRNDATIARSVCGFANSVLTTPESLGFDTSSSSSSGLNGGEIFAIIFVVLLAIGAGAYVFYLVQTGQAFEELETSSSPSTGDIEIEAMDMDDDDDDESETAPMAPDRSESLKLKKGEA